MAGAGARARQLAYFKDNIQGPEDDHDFDASRYYYNRTTDQMTPGGGPQQPGVLGGPGGLGGEVGYGREGAMPFMGSSPLSAMYQQGQQGFGGQPFQPPGQQLGASSSSSSFNNSTSPPSQYTTPSVDLLSMLKQSPLKATQSDGGAPPGVAVPAAVIAAATEISFGGDPPATTRVSSVSSPPRAALSSSSSSSSSATTETTAATAVNGVVARDSTLDMADFPALGGNNRFGGSAMDEGGYAQLSISQQLGGERLSNSNSGSNIISGAVSEGMSRSMVSQFSGADQFSGAEIHRSEDFPALPGSQQQQHHHSEVGRGFSGNSNLIGQRAQQEDSFRPYQEDDARQKPRANSSSVFEQPSPSGPPTGAAAVVTSSSEEVDAANETKYGLLGLLDVIRMTNADLNTLALGSDLTTLGLNLNSSECLYSTFASPWADSPTTREPQFSLPLCYYMQPPPLKTSHLSKFQLETLFYIFYAMPNDVLQAYSAQELYNREWAYHQDLKLWFKRGSPNDGLSVSNNQYIYFELTSWECRLFSNLHTTNGILHTNITNGLLPEEDVRVKFSTTTTANASSPSASSSS